MNPEHHSSMTMEDEGIAEKVDDNPKVPDGGWGWVVVFGSFTAHVISDGLQYTQGVLLREVRSYYGSSRQVMGMLASITTVMAYIMCK